MDGRLRPLLSICIPTKNRQEFCKQVISSVLSYKNNCFELIIQDNSDDNSLSEFVSTIDDQRLKYLYIKKSLSSQENMNISIDRSLGNYVCMIGDDDVVLPTVFEVIDYMVKNNIDSVCPAYHPSYDWPNPKIGTNGVFKIIEYKKQPFIRYLNINKTLKTLFKKGIIDYQQYQLPRIYHGIIRRDILEKVYEKAGCYFRALSPDIYSTIALSSQVKNHVVLNIPVSVLGSCPKSTTSQNQTGGHRGELSDCPHLKHRDDYIWEELIPKFYSVETIWAESAIKAARDFELNELISVFNLKRFNIVALARSKSIKEIIFRELKVNNLFYKSVFLIKTNIYYVLNFTKRAFIKIFLKKTRKFVDVKNISEALKIVAK
ncbi:glycosyltransferase family 2 protein [Tenacibaculum ovolyticum]|uniref:glycosyltransferase family 2 protein n=1 Tax=Tenacibaculum ovolyticum TaxID=104270 RepID=UPI00048A457F|nr:glycosyltransferase [Tenacibaculum ovolyticum]